MSRQVPFICAVLLLQLACTLPQGPADSDLVDSGSSAQVVGTSPAASPIASSTPAPPLVSDDLTQQREQILALTNAARAELGLVALRLNAQLNQSAQGHAENMARQTRLEHTLDGKNFSQRIEAAGYDYRQIAENIYFGSAVPADVLSAWMNSEGHRKNILTPELTELGVGFAISDVNKRAYWVQNFGTAF